MNQQKGSPRFARVEAGLAPILIIILIALAVGGYLLYQKQTNINPATGSADTANPAAGGANKTYKSVKLGLEFRYPTSWVVSDYIDQYGFVVVAPSPVQIPQGTEFIPKPITIGLNQCTNTVTNEKYPCEKSVQERVTKLKNMIDSSIYKESSYTVSGKTGTQIQGITKSDQPGGGQDIKETILPLNDYALVVSLNSKEEENIYSQILSTFKFLDQDQAGKTSPDGSFTITEEMLGDYRLISIKDNRGNIIVDDLVAKNKREIGYNVKFGCQCGTFFKDWVGNSRFAIRIVNGNSEEYEYLVDADTGKVDESSFKRIK